jgi:hypothetical protein
VGASVKRAKKVIFISIIGVALTGTLSQVRQSVVYASVTGFQYAVTHLSIDGKVQASPEHIIARDPLQSNTSVTSWMPLYYLQWSLKRSGVHSTWNGHSFQFSIPSQWSLKNDPSNDHGNLSSHHMDFVVNGHAYQASPTITAKDPASGVETTYVPVSDIDNFLQQVLSMDTLWSGSTWTIMTQNVRVPQSELTAAMSATTEVKDAKEHFVPFPSQVSISDGRGGILTAVGASRFPTADGLGQLVFFFHNGKVVGLNSNVEVTAIQSIKPEGAERFAITYANYKSTDAMVNPSLPPQTVIYTWTGSAFVPSASLAPGVTSGQVSVTHTW